MEDEKSVKEPISEMSSAQPLEDAQTESAAGGLGEWSDVHYMGVKNCPRGVTQDTFPSSTYCFNADTWHMYDFYNNLSHLNPKPGKARCSCGRFNFKAY